MNRLLIACIFTQTALHAAGLGQLLVRPGSLAGIGMLKNSPALLHTATPACSNGQEPLKSNNFLAYWQRLYGYAEFLAFHTNPKNQADIALTIQMAPHHPFVRYRQQLLDEIATVASHLPTSDDWSQIQICAKKLKDGHAITQTDIPKLVELVCPDFKSTLPTSVQRLMHRAAQAMRIETPLPYTIYSQDINIAYAEPFSRIGLSESTSDKFNRLIEDQDPDHTLLFNEPCRTLSTSDATHIFALLRLLAHIKCGHYDGYDDRKSKLENICSGLEAQLWAQGKLFFFAPGGALILQNTEDIDSRYYELNPYKYEEHLFDKKMFLRLRNNDYAYTISKKLAGGLQSDPNLLPAMDRIIAREVAALCTEFKRDYELNGAFRREFELEYRSLDPATKRKLLESLPK